jgi:ABC-2 type transport system ATP-binding protein
VISVQGLVKAYRDLTAVSGLSFEVKSGEVLGLVGPNGAGKTTTLRCLAGILPPTAGRVSISGFDLRDRPVEAKRRLAFMPDEPRLFDYLTVSDHLAFTARLWRRRSRGKRGPSGDGAPRQETALPASCRAA